MNSKVRLIEEVPGVPEDERFLLVGPGVPLRHFSTRAAAEAFLAQHGITDYSFEAFEP